MVGLPLWITSIPALLTETTDFYEGDRLWLPYVGTALLFAIPLIFVWLVLTGIWAIVSGKPATFPRAF